MAKQALRDKGTGRCAKCDDKVGYYSMYCRKCADASRREFSGKNSNKNAIDPKWLSRGKISSHCITSSITNGS